MSRWTLTHVGSSLACGLSKCIPYLCWKPQSQLVTWRLLFFEFCYSSHIGLHRTTVYNCILIHESTLWWFDLLLLLRQWPSWFPQLPLCHTERIVRVSVYGSSVKFVRGVYSDVCFELKAPKGRLLFTSSRINRRITFRRTRINASFLVECAIARSTVSRTGSKISVRTLITRENGTSYLEGVASQSRFY